MGGVEGPEPDRSQDREVREEEGSRPPDADAFGPQPIAPDVTLIIDQTDFHLYKATANAIATGQPNMTFKPALL